MYDTIAALIETELDPDLFAGGQIMSDFETGQQWSRLWRNPVDEYGARYTYWSSGHVLKVEVSLPKLIHVYNNMTEAEKDQALDVLNLSIRSAFGDLPDVRTWRCQRVDYCYMWQVPEPEWYIATYGRSDLSGTRKQEFATGVVWKQRQRWIKLYDKSKERSDGEGWLRLEVSNYRQAVSYMCENWFGCERTIAEVLRPGRSLYMLARAFVSLGMHAPVSSDAGLMRRMREHYGSSVSGAWYALCVMQRVGTRGVALGLMSSGSYYEWRKRLSDDGFLLAAGEAYSVPVSEDIERLRLPLREVLEKDENLEASPAGPAEGVLKNSAKNSDAEEELRERLGLTTSPGSHLVVEYLSERDGLAREV